LPAYSRDLRFTFVPEHGGAFEVNAFTFEEALSEPYRLCVQLSSLDAAANAGALLDQPALFTIWRGGQPIRHIHGIVSECERADTGCRRTCYRAVMAPSLVRAARCSGWRVYQYLTAPEIMADVVQRLGIADYEQHTAADHPRRAYCVQAGDTDLQFLNRLAAEEGYLYRFDHTERSHRLIHADRIRGLGEIQGGPVVYNAACGGAPREPALRRFTFAVRVRTSVPLQRDAASTNLRYVPQLARVAADLGMHDARPGRYVYPGAYQRNEAGKPFTPSLLPGLRRDARVAFAQGDDARLVPGLAFNLIGHPRQEWNKAWRPVRLRHQGVQHGGHEEAGAGGKRGTRYHCAAELIPETADWKPEPGPKPRPSAPLQPDRFSQTA